MIGLAYIFGALFLLIVVGTVAHQLKLQRLRRQRRGRGFTREQFIEAFRPLGISEKIPGTVFDYYASRSPWKNFPLSPEDTYSQVLCDDPEDMDDDARVLLNLLEIQIPPEYIRQEYGDKPIKTLRDMVLWLDWMHRRVAGSG